MGEVSFESAFVTSAEPDKRFNALARLGGGTAVSFEAYLITFSDLADWFDVI